MNSRIDVHPPFSFGLTAKGELVVEWAQPVALGVLDVPVIRISIVIPAEEVRTLRLCLEESRTIQETLSATEPEQGAH